jgi:DnaJ domain
VNPYEILQVSPVADAAVIRAAYRSLIQRYHPDRNPGNAQAAQHAALLTKAYEVLADPEQRATCDAQLNAERVGTLATRESLSVATPKSRQRHTTAGPRAAAMPWALGVVALLVFSLLVWTLLRFTSGNSQRMPPDKQLAEIRAQIESPQTAEAERRNLVARKQNLLEQHADLSQADRTMRIDDLAARSLALLTAPITVSLAPAPDSALPRLQLTISEITLVLGSFDTPKLQAHLLKHRERVIDELAQHLATRAASAATSPEASDRLKRLILESVMKSLDIRLNEVYPSSYFESPGRYGVVDVVLPQSFSLLK